MNRLAKLLTTGAAVVLLTSVVDAQQAVQPKGAVQPAKTQAAQVGSGYQGTLNRTPWFSNSDVRQQLRLNDMQYKRLNDAYNQAWTQYQQNLNNLGQDLSPDKRAEQTYKLQQNFYNNFSRTTNDILTDPQTRNRYHQMGLQYRGYDAFFDPTVQEKLNLTETQRQQLRDYGQQWRNSMSELYRDYSTDREAATRQFNEMQTREAERMNKLLTEQQQQTWRQMLGERYGFQPNHYFYSQSNLRPNQ